MNTVWRPIVLGFLLLYVVVGVSAHALSRHKTEDVYPFFSWFLFVNVPPRIQSGYEARITDLHGTRLERPLPLDSRSAIFAEPTQDRLLRVAINRLGQATKENDEHQASAARSELESYIVTPITYDLYEITYDVFAYFLRDEIVKETYLGTFDTI